MMTRLIKLYRLIAYDPGFRIRMVLVLIFALVVCGEKVFIDRQNREIKTFKQKQALVAKIPQMEEVVAKMQRAIAEANANATESQREGFRLEGVLVRNEGLCALVNGQIKTIGDVVGKYEIVQIHRDGIAVADRATGVIEVINLTPSPLPKK